MFVMRLEVAANPGFTLEVWVSRFGGAAKEFRCVRKEAGGQRIDGRATLQRGDM